MCVVLLLCVYIWDMQRGVVVCAAPHIRAAFDCLRVLRHQVGRRYGRHKGVCVCVRQIDRERELRVLRLEVWGRYGRHTSARLS